LRLSISGPKGSKPRVVELSQPFAVVGSAPGADIVFKHADVSYRHAYLQLLDGRVFCLDLASQKGIYWGEDRRSSDWIVPGQAVRIGPYTLQLLATEHLPGSGLEGRALRNPLKADLAGADGFPKYTLEFLDDSLADNVRSIDRRMTLIGRSSRCHIRLNDASVSRVHCGLVTTAEGLLMVDLLGKGGTRLDDKCVRWGLVETGSVLVVGAYVMSVWGQDPALRRVTNNSPEPSGLSSSQDADTQTPHSEAPRAHATPTTGSGEQHVAHETIGVDSSPDTGLEGVDALGSGQAAGPVIPLADREESTWLGTLFAIEQHEQTLIVTPTIQHGMFRYGKLHTESNALRQRLADSAALSLVIDLHALGYVGWEAMSVVVALARQMEATGRPAALCCPTTQIEESLMCKGITRIWPLYPSRDAALAAIKNRE